MSATEPAPELGQPISKGGCVTRFIAIGARDPATLDDAIGYGKGTMAAGFKLAVLMEPIRANHLLFAAYTHASGGRWGLPELTPDEDRKRPSVHEGMVKSGQYDVPRLQEQFAQDPDNLLGPRRIVKVIPDNQPSSAIPRDDYPRGSGIPQWILIDRHKFHVVLAVDSNGTAKTAAGWSVPVGANAAYSDRERLFKYVANVKP